jgi:hypothetical protein
LADGQNAGYLCIGNLKKKTRKTFKTLGANNKKIENPKMKLFLFGLSTQNLKINHPNKILKQRLAGNQNENFLKVQKDSFGF